MRYSNSSLERMTPAWPPREGTRIHPHHHHYRCRNTDLCPSSQGFLNLSAPGELHILEAHLHTMMQKIPGCLTRRKVWDHHPRPRVPPPTCFTVAAVGSKPRLKGMAQPGCHAALARAGFRDSDSNKCKGSRT